MINEEIKPESPPQQEGEPINMSRVHPVEGYSDSENMWVKLCNCIKDHPVENKHQNGNSMVTMQVDGKVFKLKKNPFYKDFPKLSELMKTMTPSENLEDTLGNEQE